jgi:hypothetical protein
VNAGSRGFTLGSAKLACAISGDVMISVLKA